jgi:hypothetical protein
MQLVTLREYARRKDVSLTAVQKGVKGGRIVAQTDPETGKITGIDWDTQADAWEANSRGNFKPHTLAGGRPRNDGKPPAKPAQAQTQAEPPQPPAEKGPMSLADIQRARELVKLQIDSLKLKEAQGELVPAAEQERLGADLGSKVVASLYNIPERISDDLAGMTSPHEIHKLLLTEIDMAVESLRKAYGS